MSDHAWEDYAEPAFNATAWVIEQLEDTLKTLDDNDEGEHDEFAVAKDQVHAMALMLTAIRNECYRRREGEHEVEDLDDEEEAEQVRLLEGAHAAEVDVEKIMKEQGLKEVDGVHYKEEAYTGTKGGLMERHEVDITDYLNGKESWEMVLDRVSKLNDRISYLLREKLGPTSVRLNQGRYAFLFYNPRVNLMGRFIFLDEVRGDRDGVPNRILAQWSGLRHVGGAPGVVRIFQNDTVVASKDCTHISQLINLLEDFPPDFTIEEITERWHPRRSLAEMLGAETPKKEAGK